MSLLTEEQVMLRDSARGWAQTNAPVSAFRKMRDSGNEKGFDSATFKSSFRKPMVARSSAIAASASCWKSSAARSSQRR
jgi:hypothetical protein